MKTPKAPKESAEQKAERLRAEQQQAQAIQQNVSDRTNLFARLVNPAVSLITGAVRKRAGGL